jgi:hypothetical protein
LNAARGPVVRTSIEMVGMLPMAMGVALVEGVFGQYQHPREGFALGGLEHRVVLIAGQMERAGEDKTQLGRRVSDGLIGRFSRDGGGWSDDNAQQRDGWYPPQVLG